MSRILIIPDLHLPFQHKDAFVFLDAVKEAFGLDEVVCIGDLMDKYTSTRFPKHPVSSGARSELNKVKRILNKEVYTRYKKMRMCIGNHEMRSEKRIIDAGILPEEMKTLNELYEMPKGWEVKKYFDIDGVRYEHGVGSGQIAAINRALSNGCSTVIGHVHCFAGVNYRTLINHQQIWGLNVGCLVDQEAYAFYYATEHRYKFTLGCGVILDGVPIFVPMVCDKDGNWIGEV